MRIEWALKSAFCFGYHEKTTIYTVGYAQKRSPNREKDGTLLVEGTSLVLIQKAFFQRGKEPLSVLVERCKAFPRQYRFVGKDALEAAKVLEIEWSAHEKLSLF